MQQAEIITPDFENAKDELKQYIDEMDIYQARIVLSFVKTLFLQKPTDSD